MTQNGLELFENKIHLGDCVEIMSKMPEKVVDLIITDPPFGINFDSSPTSYSRETDTVLLGYNEIDSEQYAQFTLDWLSNAKRVLKESGSMYIFSGWQNLKDVLQAIDKCELTIVNHLVWKYQFGVVTSRKYVTSHYHCLYVCENDEKRLFYPYSRFDKDQRLENGNSAHYKDKEDVWEIAREFWVGALKTPTKLPAELVLKILKYSSIEGDLVMDPFSGSGQVPVISDQMKRRYIGIEIVKNYHEFSSRRLRFNEYLIYPETKEDPDPTQTTLPGL